MNKILQIHKRESVTFSEIQDKFSLNPNLKTFAIADGAGNSFQSGIWAGMIAKKFSEEAPESVQNVLSQFKVCAQCFQSIDFPVNQNPAIAALERKSKQKGAATTFIGISIGLNNEVRIISCGDSNIFIIKGEEFDGFPHRNLATLEKEKNFINSQKLLKNEIDESYFHTSNCKINEGEIIILATDALSRFIFRHPNGIQNILNIKTFDELLHFCIEKWDNKELEEDDITAFIIEDIHSNEVSTILPPHSFRFPEFTQPEGKSQNNEINQKDMQELKNRLLSLENTIHHFQGKVSRIENTIELSRKLILILIALVALNILLLILFHPSRRTEKVSVTQKPVIQLPKRVSPSIQKVPNKGVINNEFSKQADSLESSEYFLNSKAVDTIIHNKETIEKSDRQSKPTDLSKQVHE